MSGVHFRRRKNGNVKGIHKYGNCLQKEALTLEGLAEGQEAVIAAVPDQPLLPPLGLRPGKRIRVQARGCCGGPIFAEVERRCVALGRCLAREVRLYSLDEQIANEGLLEKQHVTTPTLAADA